MRVPLTGGDAARELRREVEDRLDAAGWPWAPNVSLWLDALVIAGEGQPATFVPRPRRDGSVAA